MIFDLINWLIKSVHNQFIVNVVSSKKALENCNVKVICYLELQSTKENFGNVLGRGNFSLFSGSEKHDPNLYVTIWKTM